MKFLRAMTYVSAIVFFCLGSLAMWIFSTAAVNVAAMFVR